jgi:hypothetical protein
MGRDLNLHFLSFRFWQRLWDKPPLRQTTDIEKARLKATSIARQPEARGILKKNRRPQLP